MCFEEVSRERERARVEKERKAIRRQSIAAIRKNKLKTKRRAHGLPSESPTRYYDSLSLEVNASDADVVLSPDSLSEKNDDELPFEEMIE